MKQLISIFVFILMGTVLAEGEEMKFVTVLSSPVGTFAQLETANPTRAVQSPVVNFGTSRVTVGRIELKGAAGYIEDLYLESGTELGGNAGAYRVAEGMEVGTGGRITGGRLMANEVDFSGALEGKSEVKGSLYIDEISVAGAKAGSLTIPDEVELTGSKGGTESLEWSNEYDCDYRSKKEKIWKIEEYKNIDCFSDGKKDTCDGNLFAAYDYQTKNPQGSVDCWDIHLVRKAGPSADGDLIKQGRLVMFYREFYQTSPLMGYPEISYRCGEKGVCEDEERWKDGHFPDCPGIVGYPSTCRGCVANVPNPNKWKDQVAYNQEKQFRLEEGNQRMTNDTLYKYLDKDQTNKYNVYFKCVGPCVMACTQAAVNNGTCSDDYSTFSDYKTEKEGYTNQWNEFDTYEKRTGTFFLPVFTWRYTATCRHIQYGDFGKKTECTENSPTYDSYLLKSKSTTSSSDSKEEGTEG